ncbi:TetR/AcrR family transcriptional regulator [Noviherbaspirillum sedimenti]|uniref:TetR/AcrR family transcriptional regulator n=1 Tax=Noviherbaspirillum sedimenti TaxID=2320865 RepID=A0A3A3G748_9BURK|nr:TetR/AcrR family transcriptional regulator [Noviherbaspirillum sedimenti]RJG02559.1 TetR/AcrR family transcriptional regulator [Noviherbaspirillum sedimenti]
MDTVTSKSELTYAAIVDAGLALAAAEGIGKLSLGEVAKQLDLSKSGVFSRVGSLEALQQAVLDEFDRRFAAQVFAPALALPRGLPRLNAIVDNWIRRVCMADATSGCLYTAGSFEYDDVAGPLHDRLQQGVQQWRAGLRKTVLQALEAGHLRPDTEPEQLIFEIYSLIVGLMHDVRFLHDPKAPERMRRAYARLISTYRSFDYLDQPGLR